jgi:hypothetical protein
MNMQIQDTETYAHIIYIWLHMIAYVYVNVYVRIRMSSAELRRFSTFSMRQQILMCVYNTIYIHTNTYDPYMYNIYMYIETNATKDPWISWIQLQGASPSKMLQIVLRQTIVVPFSENNRYIYPKIHAYKQYIATSWGMMLRHMSLNMRKFESCLYFIVLSKRARYFQQVTRGKSRAMWPAVDWSAFFQIERWGGGRPSNTTGTARASSCSQGFLGFDPKWNPRGEKQKTSSSMGIPGS